MGKVKRGSPAVEMTLRDYFASKVLPMAIEQWKNLDANESDGGIFVWHQEGGGRDDCENAAALAYRMADAMMNARNGTY